MANFYTDNDDIRFLFRYYQLTRLADLMEGDYSDSKKYNWAPETAADAVDNYDRLLEVIGGIAGDFVAPRSEQIDQEGNTLNEDGTVTYAKGMKECIDRFAQAKLMAFTLPHRFGGLNCPNFIYTMSNDVVSRADAALMNIYGLQGIAETINAFANEEIKQQYLPLFAEQGATGAMVLTEPDAGSDLQAVKLRAYQDSNGQWRLHGVKRFITNGCGEVLLVLARSEPDRAGGMGLSLFVCDNGPTVKVRRLENKLGIHGSPTCEMYFDHTPCQLVGERKRGLAKYVMSLMNGARVGIASQSLGIGEAAFRVARDYAASREQFGLPIEKLPSVRDLLVEMKIMLEAARSLTMETCWAVDFSNGLELKTESGEIEDKEQLKQLKKEYKHYRRLADMLTPMSKYYASEMCSKVSYEAMSVLGGSGYMKDYPVERHMRDARITSIYEGTTQLQIVAAVRGVCSGAAESYLDELSTFAYTPEVSDLVALLDEGKRELLEAVAFVKEQPGTEYMDLHGRKLVDIAINLIVGHLFLQQSIARPALEDKFCQPGKDQEISAYDNHRKHKAVVARRFITANGPINTAMARKIISGDRSTMTDYDTIVGPLPDAN